MGILFESAADPNDRLKMNWWMWRPIETVIRRADICTEEQLVALSCNSGMAIDADTARAIGQAVAAALDNPRDLLELDGSWSDRTDDGTFHRTPEDAHRNYGAQPDRVAGFAAFCQRSGGFTVC